MLIGHWQLCSIWHCSCHKWNFGSAWVRTKRVHTTNWTDNLSNHLDIHQKFPKVPKKIFLRSQIEKKQIYKCPSNKNNNTFTFFSNIKKPLVLIKLSMDEQRISFTRFTWKMTIPYIVNNSKYWKLTKLLSKQLWTKSWNKVWWNVPLLYTLCSVCPKTGSWIENCTGL